jgi:hypothetical protein
MATKIGVVNGALVLIGDTPINSLIGGSRAQQVANTLYDSIVRSELTKHRWGFARVKAQLSLTTEVPIDQEWDSIYQLPSDLLFLIKIYQESDTRFMAIKCTPTIQAHFTATIFITLQNQHGHRTSLR